MPTMVKAPHISRKADQMSEQKVHQGNYVLLLLSTESMKEERRKGEIEKRLRDQSLAVVSSSSRGEKGGQQSEDR